MSRSRRVHAAGFRLLPSVEPMDHVVYVPVSMWSPFPGRLAVGGGSPLFNRGGDAFCSNRQTPPDRSRRPPRGGSRERRDGICAQPCLRTCGPALSAFRNIVSDLLHRLGETRLSRVTFLHRGNDTAESDDPG
jgi:hypothetical protein